MNLLTQSEAKLNTKWGGI